MSKVPKRGSLLSFCNILRKSIAIFFVFYCEAKAFRYFTGFQSCLVLFVFQTFQLSRFCQDSPGFCYSVLVSWIELVCLGFYISHHKNVHIYIIFHQHCKTIHLQWITFIVIHTLNAIKSITVLSSTKMLFWKHSIWTFECFFERHTFDLIINSGKLIQKLSSEVFFWKH